MNRWTIWPMVSFWGVILYQDNFVIITANIESINRRFSDIFRIFISYASIMTIRQRGRQFRERKKKKQFDVSKQKDFFPVAFEKNLWIIHSKFSKRNTNNHVRYHFNWLS